MKLSNRQLIINAIACITLLGVICWAVYAEYDRPWKKYQKHFKKLEYDLASTQYQNLLLEKDNKPQQRSFRIRANRLKQKLSSVREQNAAIEQVWLRDLHKADRCITCHAGADKPGLETSPLPYRTHSGDYTELHPVDTFGCTVCHEGQGPALTVNAAHGYTENWSQPLLKGSYAQSSCIKCHALGNRLPLSAGIYGASELTYGWRLFREYNCTGCHKLTDYERPAYIAPPLTSIGNKTGRKWLIQWLKDPKQYLPDTKMPQFNLTDQETENITDYLISLKTDQSCEDTACSAVSSESAVTIEGKQLFSSLGCRGCHMINEKGSTFAPDLTGIGSKVKPAWLVRFLKKPQSINPDSPMPSPMITDNEIQSITAYLMSLRSDRIIPAEAGIQGQHIATREDIEKGKKLVRDYGCTGCHEIGELPRLYNAPALDGIGDKRVDELVFTNMKETEKTIIQWLKTRIINPGTFATDKIVTRMPDYGFTKEQTRALVVFLLGIRENHLPQQYVKRLMHAETTRNAGKKVLEKYNCLGCHTLNNEGGVIGPVLTQEAKKSRPEWIYGFLKKPHKIRPDEILKAGMPDFSMSDKEINALVNYLSFVAAEPYPYYSAGRRDIPPEDVWDGEKLYREIFACSACHTIDGSGGRVGPDHTDLASRLKRDWIEKWLENPQAVKPDVRMPKFTFKDWQFKALTNYLMTLGKYRFVRVKSKEY